MIKLTNFFLPILCLMYVKNNGYKINKLLFCFIYYNIFYRINRIGVKKIGWEMCKIITVINNQLKSKKTEDKYSIIKNNECKDFDNYDLFLEYERKNEYDFIIYKKTWKDSRMSNKYDSCLMFGESMREIDREMISSDLKFLAIEIHIGKVKLNMDFGNEFIFVVGNKLFTIEFINYWLYKKDYKNLIGKEYKIIFFCCQYGEFRKISNNEFILIENVDRYSIKTI